MDTHAYKIKGMDCAEEIAILKREVGPIVGGEDSLSFDLLKGRMIVASETNDETTESICGCVAKTGMRAIPWEEFLKRQDAEGDTFWELHGRTLLCTASGLLLLTATLAHGIAHSWKDALTGHGESHTYPWYVIALYSAAIICGAWNVAPKALFALRSMRPDMNLLMTVAIIGAVILGEWLEAAAVAFLFALALVLESWSVGRARKAISSLMDLSPTRARYRCPHHGDIEEKPVEDVPVGVSVLVRPGEKIPLDGTVTVGTTFIDEAAITGESIPVEKSVGDTVYAGTINGDGSIEFESTKDYEDTTLSRIIQMVEEAQARRAPSEQWVETFARYYTPAMMVLALAIAIVPPLLLGGAWTEWFYQALVILVIACPCALVISTPVSIVAGLATAARNGVLIKGGAYLEAPASLRAIAMDKTGTVTMGKAKVQNIVPLNGHDTTELLQRAAALEAESSHPLAQAILNEARAKGIEFSPASDCQNIQGKGTEGTVDDRPFWIGSHRFLHEKGGETPECHDQALALEDEGHTVVAIGNGRHTCGLISIADAIRPESKDVVDNLHASGIQHVVMLTGDNEQTAKAIADKVGFDTYKAELLPEEKVEAISTLVKKYNRVAMVGDGVNDAPAMATSSLGIAMGAAGTDVAIETADIALMADDLSKLPWLINHSKRTLRTIKQNIAFALGLKLIFIILAFAGWATLWMAIAADMGASLLVIFNGLRLLRSE